jgi:hypothetical protein
MVTLPVAQAPAAAALPTLTSTDTARIQARVGSLTLGGVTYFAAVKVQRVSLLTFCVDGTYVSAEDAAAEIAYLVAEREAIEDEPSLLRAAEVVQRQLANGPLRLDGSFTVRTSFGCGHQVQIATWSSKDWRASRRDEVRALDELVEWANGMGLGFRATRVGWEVVATLPAYGPGVAKTSARAREEAA